VSAASADGAASEYGEAPSTQGAATADAAGRRVYTVMLLPGDGVGPEIVAAAQEVLAAAGERFGFTVGY